MSSVIHSTSIVERNGDCFSLSIIKAKAENRLDQNTKLLTVEARGKTRELSSRVFGAMAFQGFRINEDRQITVDCGQADISDFNACSIALCAIAALKDEALHPGVVCLAGINVKGELLPCPDVVKIIISLVKERIIGSVIVSRKDAQRLIGLCTRVKIYACENIFDAYKCATENPAYQSDADVIHVPDNRTDCPEKAPRRILETLYVAARGHHNILFVGPVKIAYKYARMLAEMVLPKPTKDVLDSAWAKNNDSSFKTAPLVKLSRENLTVSIDKAKNGVLYLGGIYHLSLNRQSYLSSIYKHPGKDSPILVGATDVRAYGQTNEEAVKNFKTYAQSSFAQLFDIIVITDKEELFPMRISQYLKEMPPLTSESIGEVEEQYLTSLMMHDGREAFGTDLNRVIRVAATLKTILRTPFLRWNELETAYNNFCHLDALLKAIDVTSLPEKQVSTARV